MSKSLLSYLIKVIIGLPPAKAGDNIKACGEAEEAKRKYKLKHILTTCSFCTALQLRNRRRSVVLSNLNPKRTFGSPAPGT